MWKIFMGNTVCFFGSKFGKEKINLFAFENAATELIDIW